MKKAPSVGVGVIIRKGSQVLLLRRKNVHGEGSWSTPGGHLDFRESPEDCAIRETREETALTITSAKFVALTNDVFEAEDRHYITIWMESEFQGGEPKLNAPYESDSIAWYSWDSLPQPLFIPFRHLISGESYPSPALPMHIGFRKTDQDQ